MIRRTNIEKVKHYKNFSLIVYFFQNFHENKRFNSVILHIPHNLIL